MLRVASYLPSAGSERAVAAAIAGRATLDAVREPDGLLPAVLQRRASVIVTQPVDVMGRPIVRDLFARSGDDVPVPVLVVLRAERSDMACIADAIRAGAADVALVGIDDVWDKISRAVSSHASARGVRIRQVVRELLPPDSATLIENCMGEARRGLNADALARHYAMSGKTLQRYFRARELPAPGRVLRWLRLLLAIEHLQSTDATVERTARLHGYSTPTVLREALFHLTGMLMSEVRRPEGFDIALQRFGYELKSGPSDVFEMAPAA